MTSPNRLNLWMVADTAERDLLHPDLGLAVGDFCLVEATNNLYVCTALPLMLPVNSEWRPIAGLPTFGHYSVSGKNYGAVPAEVFEFAAFTFRAVLDAIPGIMLMPTDSANWTVDQMEVVDMDVFGFRISSFSNMINPGDTAWETGLYTILY